MENCPYCGAPGSFREAVDGCCYVCGMVLPISQDAGAPESDHVFSEEAAEVVETSRNSAETTSSDAPTIALESPPPTPMDDSIDPPAISLIQPRNLSPEYARRVTAAWQATKSPFQNPQETLNSSSSKAGESDNLLIGARSLADSKDPRPADYELTEIIGEGNMGTVWSARQASLDRQVAVKLPKESMAASSLGRELFISEVVVTGQLDHPNIVPIYDLARDESGKLFYAMKRVEGRSWDECMHEPGRTRLDNVEVLMKACDAIRFAHDRGVLHRDIKPQNIMIGKYGEVSVMDWGIALRLDEQLRVPGASRINPSGTPAYMAPEMATGNASELGPHTDVYLLGAVLYEIITGEPPHPAPDPSHDPFVQQNACLLIAARNVITPAAETGELVDVAYKAMATDISDRFQSVAEFQTAIREYYSHSESVVLAERGQDHLTKALEARNGVYEDFNKARFAFEEALQLWPENSRARSGLAQATLEHAGTALKRGDYALGLSLLNRDNPAHGDLIKKLSSAKRKSDRNRFVAFVSAIAAVSFLILGIGVSLVFALYANAAKNDAESARHDAERQKVVAVSERDEKEKQRQIAVEKTDEVQKLNVSLEIRRKELADANERISHTNKELEESNAKLADQITETQRAKVETEKASYRSEIGLAAEEVRRNSFSSAQDILERQADNETQKQILHWEWGHLMYLAKELATDRFEVGGAARVEAVALSPDNKWIAAGTDDGEIHVWWRPDPQKPALKVPSQIKEHAVRVTALAISRDGQILASAAGNEVHFWRLPASGLAGGLAATGKPLRYTSPILSVALSPTSDEVLTSTEDSTAQLWSPGQPERPLRVFRGHMQDPNTQEGQVWEARFSPDGRNIVTAGADGTVRLWDVNGSELRKFEGHQGPVYTADFSKDGSYIVSGGRDHRLLAWQSQAGSTTRDQEIRQRLATRSENRETVDHLQLGEHAAAIRSVAFSPDGKTLFTASDDNTVRVWNLGNGIANAELIKSLRGHGGWVRSCSVAADGKYVLSGSYDGEAILWNWERYVFPRVLRPETDDGLRQARVTSAASSPDARWIATAAEDGTVTVWNMANPLNPTWQTLREGHDWQATTGVYFPGGNRLVTAAGDNSALIWDARRGNELLRIGHWNTKGGTGWRGVVAVARHGRTIATGSDEPEILAKIWDAQSGRLIASLVAPQVIPRSEPPEATAIAFSPNDETVFVGDQWGQCNVFDVATGAAKTFFLGHSRKINAAAYLPDGRLLTASSDSTVAKWNLKEGETNPQPELVFAHRDRVVAMDVSPDGAYFITATDARDDITDADELRVWSTNSAERHTHQLSATEMANAQSKGKKRPAIRSVALHPTQTEALITVAEPSGSTYRLGRWQWSGGATPVEWAPLPLRDTAMALYAPRSAGAMLTVGGRGARLRLAGRMQDVMTYRPQRRVQSIAFSADNRLLASASDDGTIKLWRVDGERWLPEQKLLASHGSPVLSVAFHPLRSDVLLSADEGGSIRLWQRAAEDWRMTTIGGDDARRGSVRQAIFSPPDANQQVNILAAADKELKIWSLAGQLLGTLPHEGRVLCVAVSPDQNLIATGVGSEVQIWDAATRRAVGTPLAGHYAEITSLAFSPDGRRLFTASRDFTVKLWDTNGWQELLTLDDHADSVVSVSFFASPEFPSLLTADAAGQAMLWPSTSWSDRADQ